MVEDKYSINTILSFGAKSVDPEVLEQLLIGRSSSADYLFNAIKGIAENENNQQILVVGQRGMGKTHLMRILFHRSQIYIKQEKLVIAYFSEEEYGVANYFDFLIRILYAFIRWDNENGVFLENSLEQLQSTTIENRILLAENIIDKYRKGKPLLILAENFGDILNDIGPEEQGKLRAWMYTRSKINIIATSQSLSDDFDSEDRPFYGFFQTYYLKPLSFRDTFQFLIALAKLDNRNDVVQHLKNKGQAQVRAIFELVKGNHRLLVTFYQFLKSDTLAKLSNHFIKTINDLKPYYETFIRYLPPQQQKVLRYIALSRKPRQGTEIQRNCFIDQKSLSKVLSELARRKLIEIITDPVDRRNKLYDINEPLLRISIEVGEHKEGITALFVDFLALYYDEDELKVKILKFSDLLNFCKNPDEKKEFQYEIAAIERALKLKTTEPNGDNNNDASNIVNSVSEALLTGDPNIAEKLLKEGKKALSSSIYNSIMGIIMATQGKYEEAIKFYEKINKSDPILSGANFPWAYSLAKLARETNDINLFEAALVKFEVASEGGESSVSMHHELGELLIHFGRLNKNELQINKGLDEIKLAISFEPENFYYYTVLATKEMSLSIENQDAKIANSAILNFMTAFKLAPTNQGVAALWGGCLAFLHLVFDGDLLQETIFFDSFKALEQVNRIKCWRKFSQINTNYLLKNLANIFILDLAADREEMSIIAADWIIKILGSNLEDLTINDISGLKNFLNQIIKIVPELSVLHTYTNLYLSIIIQKDISALFEIPKEQREFFTAKVLEPKKNRVNDLELLLKDIV